jgi:hypothetical protein
MEDPNHETNIVSYGGSVVLCVLGDWLRFNAAKQPLCGDREE